MIVSVANYADIKKLETGWTVSPEVYFFDDTVPGVGITGNFYIYMMLWGSGDAITNVTMAPPPEFITTFKKDHFGAIALTGQLMLS